MTPSVNIQPNIEAHRPLRYTLRKGDQIFFLHIPKTAGTSLIKELQKQVEPEAFFSLIGAADMTTQEEIVLIQKARIVRAHRTYEFLKYFTRRPYVITMLRHPVDRVISNYAHLSRLQPARLLRMVQEANPTRDDSPVSLEEYLRLPNPQNRLVQYLAGYYGILMPPFTHYLELAKVHLENFAFFGLQERFEDSLKLLAYTFDWPPIEQSVHLQSAPPGSKPTVTPELRALAEACNAVDLELYTYARALFESRFRRLERLLKEQSAR